MKKHLIIIIFSLFALLSCKKAKELNIDLTGDWVLVEQGDDLADKSMRVLFGSMISFTQSECTLRPLDSIEVPIPVIKKNGQYKLDYKGVKYGFKVINNNEIQFNLLTVKAIYKRQ